MSYTIYKSNGLQLLTLLDGTLDTSTGLNLVGKNYINYGTVQNENFVWLLENQASATAPLYPLTGQLWYDTATATLKYYTGTAFNPLAIAGNSSVTVGQLETRLAANVAALYAGLTANVITVTGLVTAANTAMKLYVDANNAIQLSQITSANTAIGDVQANVGSFYTWANANFGSSNYSNTTAASYLTVSPVITGINANVAGAAAAITAANIAMELYVADLNTAQVSRVTAANASIATLSTNVGSFYTYANTTFGTSNYGNANIAAYLPTSTVITGISSTFTATNNKIIDANVGMKDYVDAGNLVVSNRITAVVAGTLVLQANVQSFQTYANTTFGTSNYGNANVATYLPTSTFIANISGNVTAANTAFNDANIRMKDYVDARDNSITTAWTANAVTQQGQITTLQSQVNGPAFLAKQTVGQNIATASTITYLDLVFNSVVKDTNSGYNSSTGIYTVPRTGYYQISGGVTINPASISQPINSYILATLVIFHGSTPVAADSYITGAGFLDNGSITVVAMDMASVSTLVYLEAGNTIKCALGYAKNSAAGTWNTLTGALTNIVPNYFQAVWIRGA